MDILHLTPKQVEEMNAQEFITALDYAWKTYTLRRYDYVMSRMFGREKSSEKDITVNMTADDVSRIEKEMEETDEMTPEEKASFKKQILERYKDGGFIKE